VYVYAIQHGNLKYPEELSEPAVKMVLEIRA